MLSKVECIFFNVSAVRSTACMHLAVLAWVLDIKRKAEHTHTQDKHTHIIIKREAKHKHKDKRTAKPLRQQTSTTRSELFHSSRLK